MSANNLIKSYSSKLGERNGTKRVWIESQKLFKVDFSKEMRFEPHYDFENKKIVLKPGISHKMTYREKNESLIIDILNKNISEIFEGFEHVCIKLFEHEIVIEPLKEEVNQQFAKSKSNTNSPKSIEIFAGGGTLVKALHDAGVQTIAAVELEDKYLQNLEANNPGIVTHCGDLSKFDIGLLPKNADVVAAGVPCEAFSIGNTRSERFEDHPTGSLAFYVLKIVDVVRPSVVIIEEVPNFKNSAIASLCRYVLTSMGYNLSETILHANEYGSLTKRKRFCMVASIKKGFEFDESLKSENSKIVQDILEIPIEDREWLDAKNNATIAYSLEKEKEHIRKGEGFRIGRTYLKDAVTPTITKGYYKGRLTDPILCHPFLPNTYSWFTPRELARINGLPEDYIIPDRKSTAGEIIGQGVSYNPFYAVGQMVVKHFSSIEFDKEAHEFEQYKTGISANNISYDDKSLKAFMTGTLF